MDFNYYILRVGMIYDSIETVTKMPKKEKVGVLYLLPNLSVQVAPIAPSSFQLTGIELKK